MKRIGMPHNGMERVNGKKGGEEEWKKSI